jgi:hypothetical protein
MTWFQLRPAVDGVVRHHVVMWWVERCAPRVVLQLGPHQAAYLTSLYVELVARHLRYRVPPIGGGARVLRLPSRQTALSDPFDTRRRGGGVPTAPCPPPTPLASFRLDQRPGRPLSSPFPLRPARSRPHTIRARSRDRLVITNRRTGHLPSTKHSFGVTGFHVAPVEHKRPTPSTLSIHPPCLLASHPLRGKLATDIS